MHCCGKEIRARISPFRNDSSLTGPDDNESCPATKYLVSTGKGSRFVRSRPAAVSAQTSSVGEERRGVGLVGQHIYGESFQIDCLALFGFSIVLRAEEVTFIYAYGVIGYIWLLLASTLRLPISPFE